MVTESATKVDDSMFGGNASAEGGVEEAAEDGPDKNGCNVVLANRLQPTTYSKKDYQTHIKVYKVHVIMREGYHPWHIHIGTFCTKLHVYGYHYPYPYP